MSLTTGTVNDCGALVGGGKTIWLVDTVDVASFTFAGGLYTTVTMVSSAVFKKFEFSLDSMEIRENVDRENKSHKVTHALEFYLDKLDQAQQDAIQEMMDSSNCGMIGIVEDANLTKWVLGYSEAFLKQRPLELLTTVSTSGKLLGDQNGSLPTLQSEDADTMKTFTGVVPE